MNRPSVIPIKSQSTSAHKQKSILKFTWNYKRAWIAKTNLKKIAKMKELLTQISRHIQSHGHKSNVVEEQ